MVDTKKLLKSYQPKAGPVLELDRQLAIVRFSPCGKFLVGGGYDASVRRWDATEDPFAELSPLAGHNGWVQALAFHPDGKRLFSADTWGRLCCWPFADKDPKPTWKVEQAHDGWVRQLAVSPDGGRVATCGRDGALRLWTPEGKKAGEWKGAGVDLFSVAFHPDGKSLVTGDLKGLVRQHDLTGKEIRRLDAGKMYLLHRIQDVGGVRCLAFDPEGKTLAVAGAQPQSGGFVQAVPLVLLFDWAEGKVKQTLTLGAANEGYVYEAAWHAGGFWMMVTSGQPGAGKLHFHRPGDAKPFFTQAKMANCHSLAVHPGGKRLVVSATNRGSNGNGRRLTKDREYPGNYSPLHVWDLPAA
jgi:WD40 repeat protein